MRLRVNRVGVAGAVCFALVVTAIAPAAWAAGDPSADDLERARTFFDAGAQAYATERYADAVKSFELARQVVPKPSILFSLAQAERKLFVKTAEPATLRAALAHYREYLEKVPKGGRSADAREAKDELEARLEKLDPRAGTTPGAPSAAPASAKRARVTVISPTAGARASYDGGEPQELPLFVDVEPGRHSVRVFADGYAEAVQEVSGDKPVDIPLNVALREKPARLVVALGARGDLLLDGRLLASTPVGGPIEVEPGVHVVSVSVNGKRAWSQEITFARDRELRVEPRLERSDQRSAAWVVLGAGGLSTVVGLLSGLGALGEESKVKDIDEKRAQGDITADQLKAHNDGIDRRDSLRTTSIVTLSVGGALLAAGALLYVFDRPSVAVVPPRPVEQPKPRVPSLELSASPAFAPGTWGGTVVGRF
jgi:hypothetical protein